MATREAKALLFNLESLNHAIVNSRVDCFVDNQYVVSSWENKASGTLALSQVLQCNSASGLTWPQKFVSCLQLLIRPICRRAALSDTDCKLSPLASKLVQQSYGPHTLDLFILASSVQCDQYRNPLRFYASFPNPGCSGVNAFGQINKIRSENAYAFAPSSSWVHSSSFSLLCPALSLSLPQICDLVWWPILRNKAFCYFKVGSKVQTDILFSQILTSMAPSLHTLTMGYLGLPFIFHAADCSFSSPSTASSCSTSPPLSFGPIPAPATKIPKWRGLLFLPTLWLQMIH